jgi:L-histidine Nalpha-methyltransferase
VSGAGTLKPAAPGEARRLMCAEVADGLRLSPPKLSPKFFYDERGARLFDEITRLDAYYPTRTELAILRAHLPAIATRISRRARIVEFGSGSGLKTRALLRALEQPAEYVAVDIAERQLRDFAASLRREFPALHVRPVCADYTQHWTLPGAGVTGERTVAFFPGSTIGNFEERDALAFLRRAHHLVGAGGGLLIGADLHKDTATLELAYNDPEGVTADFNLNVLTRLNRDCGTDFDVDAFSHLATYDRARRRIESRLPTRRLHHHRVLAQVHDPRLRRAREPGRLDARPGVDRRRRALLRLAAPGRRALNPHDPVPAPDEDH